MATAEDAFDPDLIRELAKLLDETGLSEIEIEKDGRRVRVASHRHAATPTFITPAPLATPIAATPGNDLAREAASHPGLVISPMVGTAYLGAEPGARPFVDIGSDITIGDTLLIIEAMKTMNQIPAPRSGKIVQILVEDGQPVEFGEPLVIIE